MEVESSETMTSQYQLQVLARPCLTSLSQGIFPRNRLLLMQRLDPCMEFRRWTGASNRFEASPRMGMAGLRPTVECYTTVIAGFSADGSLLYTRSCSL